jgi:outer membrane protein assembly factor BamC
MLRAVFLLLLVSLSGCSTIFGDTFSDKAEGYRDAELSAKMQQIEGQPALPIQDILFIPALNEKQQTSADSQANEQAENGKQDFVTPAPQALVVIEEDEDVASLAESQNQSLNPRLERDGAGTQILRLDGRYGLAWIAIAEAVDKTDYKLLDLNRSTGTYYVTIFDPMAEKEEKSFWAWLTNAEELGQDVDYLLKLNRSRLGVYLSLQSDLETLADDALSVKVLSDIEQNLTE